LSENKEAKKLRPLESWRHGSREAPDERFLVLFFKKEPLPSSLIEP